MVWHLAQLNVARLLHPVEAPETADFMAALDPINALADAARGFVWRLQTEAGNATEVDVFGDPMVIVNYSIWESVDALRAFVYRDDHLEVMRRRREWFEPHGEPHLALWWVVAGTIPPVEEAVRRLETLRRVGPSPAAFTFAEVRGSSPAAPPG